LVDGQSSYNNIQLSSTSPDRQDSLTSNQPKRSSDFERELKKERESNEELKNDYKGIKDEYEKLLIREFPQMEEIKREFLKEITEHEREKFEKEKHTILKELQNRVEKVPHLLIDFFKCCFIILHLGGSA
jgi:replication fork clamp-binding protein CrfC